MNTSVRVTCLILFFFTSILCIDVRVWALADEPVPANNDKPVGEEIDLAKRDLKTLESELVELKKKVETMLTFDELNREIRLYEGLRDRPNMAQKYDDLVKQRQALGVTFTKAQIANAKRPLAAMELKVRKARIKIKLLEKAERLKNAPPPKTVTRPNGKRHPVTGPAITIDTSKPWKPMRQNLVAAVSSAPKREVENLLEPVKTTRYDGDRNLIWAPNPDGKTWDVIPIYFNSYGGTVTLPIIDLGSGQVRVESHPRMGWHLAPNVLAPNGKVYISAMRQRNVTICTYDPAKNKLTLDAVPVPKHVWGETHPIIRSTDGMIFAGGGHPTRAVSLIMIDPRTNRVTDFGACGPSHSPSAAYNYYMGADDTHAYIASGKVPWYLLAVNRRTKQTAVLAKTEPSGGLISVYQKPHGVTASVRTGAGAKRQDYWCYQGRLFPTKGTCPWPNSGTDWQKALPPKPLVYSERAVPPPGKQAEMWFKTNVPKAGRDPKYPGWSRFSYDVPLYAMGSHRMIELPDGRIFGTAGSYTGNYIYDPASGTSTYLGAMLLSHYSTLIHDNKVWMSGYPGARLYVYDLSKPWNMGSGSEGPGSEPIKPESPESNPQLVGSYGKSGCHKIYSAAVGASGHVYGGGRWMRTGTGGGLGWWDAKAKKEDGFWKPVSNHAIAYMCSVSDGKYIVISTKREKDNLLNKPIPNEGKLFIVNDAKKEIVREITPVKNVPGPGPIVWAGGNRVIGMSFDPSNAQGSILYGVDVEKGEVSWSAPLPYKLPLASNFNQKEQWDFRLGPDGKIWTFLGNDVKMTTLVRIDPQTVKVEAIATVSMGGRLAFSGSDVYLSGTTYLRRVRGVVRK